MDKSKIKQLAVDSFTNNQIDESKAKKISRLLDKPSLREYIRVLKLIEQKKTIILMVPDDKIGNIAELGKKISKMYPDKRVLVKTDPELIAGVRIINNDLVYELSLQQILEDAVSKI
jgi:hypothetical protein